MPSLYDALIRHQVFLEGLKEAQGSLAQDTVTRIFNYYITELRNLDVSTLDEVKIAQLRRLLATLRDISVKDYAQYSLTFNKFLRSFTGVQVSGTARIIQSVGKNARKVAGGTFNKDFNESLFKKIVSEFMPFNGKNVADTVDGVGSQMITEIENAIRQGFVNKDTLKKVIERLKGVQSRTPSGAMKTMGGIYNKWVNEAKAVAKTVIQHTSEYANHAVQSLHYEYYLWVSVIDSGTTQVCTERDGKRYKYYEGPLPPAHRGCRSRTVPDDDNIPTQRKGFISWLKDQPNRLQDRFLGSSKADALRNDTLTADEAKSFKSENSLTLKQYGNAINDVLKD